MAIPKIKATYSLDVETIRVLEDAALRWKVSKSEALRRAIRALADSAPDAGLSTLQALDRLQARLELSEAEAKRWADQVRDERRASGLGLEG